MKRNLKYSRPNSNVRDNRNTAEVTEESSENDIANDPSPSLQPDTFRPMATKTSRPNTHGPINHELQRPSKKIKVCLYTDSQGRKVAGNLLDNENLSTTAVIKPGAKLQDVVPVGNDNLGPDDFAVILAGSNDVSRNEAKDLHIALRKRLADLHETNVIVFSVPHRHDLVKWSCVNDEIRNTNLKIKKVCRYFKNCSFIDISNLGIRFHTKHGLHLNDLGKKFVSQRILECIDKNVGLLNSKETCHQPIPLGMGDSTFLEVK